MSESLRVIARMIAKPELLERLLPAFETLVAETRKEPGCLQYDVLRGTDRPEVFVFVETWESRAHWEQHFKGEAIRRFNEAIPDDAFAEGEVHPMLDHLVA